MARDDFPDDSEIGFIVEGSLVAGVCFVGCVAGVVFVCVAGFMAGFVALFFFSTFSPSTGSSHFIFTTAQAKHAAPSFWMKQLCFKHSQHLQLFSLTTPVDSGCFLVFLSSFCWISFALPLPFVVVFTFMLIGSYGSLSFPFLFSSATMK